MNDEMVIIDDGQVENVWACKNDNCDNYEKEERVNPTFYDGNGTPICASCGDDLVYIRTEVAKNILESCAVVF